MTETALQKNILLLDDDSFLADMYAAQLTARGLTVHESLSADDALKTLREGFPASAVVFDIRMPGMDGLTFIKTVLDEKLAPNARLIALTNDGIEGEREKVLELGALYLVKVATDPADLVTAIETGALPAAPDVSDAAQAGL